MTTSRFSFVVCLFGLANGSTQNFDMTNSSLGFDVGGVTMDDQLFPAAHSQPIFACVTGHDPGPCRLPDDQIKPYHHPNLDSIDRYMEKYRWPKTPIVRAGNANVSNRKVLILYLLLNFGNLSAPVSWAFAEQALVGMEAFRRLGSKHRLEYGVMVLPGTASELEPLSKIFDFRIFERDMFADPDTAPAHIQEHWGPYRIVAYDIMKAEIFNFEGQYDKVALVDTDTILVQRVDELFDDDHIYASRDPYWRVDSPCWNSGFVIAKPSKFIYNLFKSVYLTREYTAENGWQNSGVGACFNGGEMQGEFD